jgi:phenylacetic acid degradation operon negative regulatory protein
VHLRPESTATPSAEGTLRGMLVVHGESAEHPEALRQLWPSQEIAASYRDFVSAYRPLLDALERGAALTTLDAMAARTLLIHDWRRIVLRDPGLPAALLPADWPGEEARATMHRVYAKLARPSEAWLEEAGIGAPKDGAAAIRGAA